LTMPGGPAALSRWGTGRGPHRDVEIRTGTSSARASGDRRIVSAVQEACRRREIFACHLPASGHRCGGRCDRRPRDQVGNRHVQPPRASRQLGLSREPTIIDGRHVAHAKPEPDLLLLAARQLEVDTGRRWYVGDSTGHMISAPAAGMAVAFTIGSAVDTVALDRRLIPWYQPDQSRTAIASTSMR